MEREKGFTLAEVLIALTVIGVVAALTIPQLVKNMNDYAFTKSKEITLAKITEATKVMKSNDVLSGYTSNDAFADEFQKYMKITNRCDSSNLTKCFPAKFKSGNDSIDTATLTTGSKLDANNLSSNTIGLMLANGTSMLISLRDSAKVSGACDRIDPVDNTSSTIGCLSFLYDINGSGAPNAMGKDIGAVNVNIVTMTCTMYSSLCIADMDIYPITPMNTCTGQPDTSMDTWGSSDAGCATNYWAGAKKACQALGMRLPTGSAGFNGELATMYNNRVALGLVLGEPYYGVEDIGYTYMGNAFAWGSYFGNGHPQSDWTVKGTLSAQGYTGRVRARCVK